MSADTDFRALLAGHAALTSLVSNRIALNAVPQGSAMPLVVFTTNRQIEHGIDNTIHGTQVLHDVQCFAATAAEAESVASAVRGAIATNGAYVITAEASGFDAELELDAATLTVEHWIV